MIVAERDVPQALLQAGDLAEPMHPLGVVSDWEHRFGACVVAVGSDTLHLSVAAHCWEFWWD
ncbi:hypothetical protein ACIGXA_39150 [Streptomyces fildesensis]|uniref:Uncharacterized protein n=1 Tax=Streptomyces fildesensis TaxID=375757 RepID=A0ABW8CKE4_9ACTN